MKRIINVICLASILISCQKKESTTTGNPLTVNFKMSASQISSGLALNSTFDKIMNYFNFSILPQAQANVLPVMNDANGNTVSLAQGWMVIKEIEFKMTEAADSSEVDGDDVKLSGPYVVDLLLASPQTIGNALLNMSGIRRIKMKFHNADSLPSEAPVELSNNSIYFRGTINGDNFTFSTQAGGEFEVGGPNLIPLRDQIPLLLSIRIVPLISKIDFSLLLSNFSPPYNVNDSQVYDLGTSICPEIDASSTKVYDCFIKGLKQQALLGDDQNEDGEIESDETGNK